MPMSSKHLYQVLRLRGSLSVSEREERIHSRLICVMVSRLNLSRSSTTHAYLFICVGVIITSAHKKAWDSCMQHPTRLTTAFESTNKQSTHAVYSLYNMSALLLPLVTCCGNSVGAGQCAIQGHVQSLVFANLVKIYLIRREFAENQLK